MEVSAMSLSERERQALQSIECKLAGDDPGLASMLSTFTRLTAGEALPTWENIGTAPGSRPHRSVPPRRVRLRWQHAWALFWLIGMAALIALALMLGHDNGRMTCAPLTIACARQTPRRATGTDTPAVPGFTRSPPHHLNQASRPSQSEWASQQK
jgi:hypothetical protein